MKKIGTSLTMCVHSIAKGEVDINDVEFIITSTNYPDRKTMSTEVRRTMWGKHVAENVKIAEDLWDAGKIYQSQVRLPQGTCVKSKWIDIKDIFIRNPPVRGLVESNAPVVEVTEATGWKGWLDQDDQSTLVG